ncbi:MAG: hypothetical protein IKP67_09310, partial [Spirochaetales bacterium]|nr:hypothetical protein [Spirochaetales bacterium]
MIIDSFHFRVLSMDSPSVASRLKNSVFFRKKMQKFSVGFSFNDHRQLSLPCAVDGLAIRGEPAE